MQKSLHFLALILGISIIPTYANDSNVTNNDINDSAEQIPSHTSAIDGSNSSNTNQFMEGVQPPRLIRKPRRNLTRLYPRLYESFPRCHCDEKGNPLEDCNTQKVELQASIKVDTEGLPSSILLDSSTENLYLRRAIYRELRKMRFIPALRNGHPIESYAKSSIFFEYEPQMEAVCASRRELQELIE